jgi:hypothetical protein
LDNGRGERVDAEADPSRATAAATTVPPVTPGATAAAGEGVTEARASEAACAAGLASAAGAARTPGTAAATHELTVADVDGTADGKHTEAAAAAPPA